MNPFALALHGNLCPAQHREGACICTPRCAACGAVRFCFCLQRSEDAAREEAEDAARRRGEEDAWAQFEAYAPVYDDDAADRDYELGRGRRVELEQQRADHDRNGGR